MVYRLVNIQRWSCGPNSPSPFSLPSKLLGFSCCFTGGPDGLVGNKSRRRLLLPINRAFSHITAKCGLLWHQTCGAF
ncbi:hypothetical protein NEUTE1DRAFT_48614 [Neurospora tetrasperma FGSC 2508]|uniref:Uncharacterized protein n=1 Tax=Neurospora tetrasperma (strain FGSC 2508 / ATCC MYA-4615 / P0657) TaxID=510951 RepID=F8MWR8_NEUT8|nr:uncharacterized protein NEUTE1DRAFT_48614 [Neurospora tetrasperma FGSC 2508]EGO54189.1 hypothetical protein NEUTE1DRAFT_48614 [Neurospora tetrasperma FGSC 2508]EGZ68379.1 hypothetical protein NEUTE2DRAFT_133036 [Neurospora tetrasperma FGSC 2509]